MVFKHYGGFLFDTKIKISDNFQNQKSFRILNKKEKINKKERERTIVYNLILNLPLIALN